VTKADLSLFGDEVVERRSSVELGQCQYFMTVSVFGIFSVFLKVCISTVSVSVF